MNQRHFNFDSYLVLCAIETVPAAAFTFDILLPLALLAREAADGLRRLWLAELELDLCGNKLHLLCDTTVYTKWQDNIIISLSKLNVWLEVAIIKYNHFQELPFLLIFLIN